MVPSVQADEEGEGLAAKPSAAASALPQDDRASMWDGYSYKERDAQSILLEEDEPLSPNSPTSPEGRKSGEQLRTSLDRAMRSATGAAPADGTSPPPISEAQKIVAQMAAHAEDSSEDVSDSQTPSESSVQTEDAATLSYSPVLPTGTLSAEPTPQPKASFHPAHQRRKSGIAALDRDLPSDSEDTVDSDDDEDEDWDMIEKPVGRGDINGPRGGQNLFSRGVVDKYRFGALKRKDSARGLFSSNGSGSTTPRSASNATLRTAAASSGAAPIAAGADEGKGSKRGLSFKGGFRVRPKPSQQSSQQSIRNLVTSPSPSPLNAAARSASYSGQPSASSSSNTSNTSSDRLSHPLSSPEPALGRGLPALPPTSGSDRSSSVSPTKGLRSVSGSTDDSAGAASSVVQSPGEKLKKFGKNLFRSNPTTPSGSPGPGGAAAATADKAQAAVVFAGVKGSS